MTAPADRASEACRDRYGEPSVVASAPGRVNLVGGHTDYNDGFVFPVAVDRRTAVAARPRGEPTVRVYSRAYDEAAAFPLDSPEPGEPPWADYVRGVAWALREEGRDLRGVDLAVASEVPQGAGLASSAALEVAVAFALVAAGGGDPGERRRDLARACQRAENEFVGVECGIMDQLAAVLGEQDRALLLDCRDETTELLSLPPDVAVLVVDTNVAHSLADSAYNERRRECKRAVELLDRRLDHPVRALRDVSVAEFERHAGALPEPVRSRCSHVVHENERVLAAADALREGDVAAVGDLMAASHAGLRDDYEVSCRELDLLVELLDREGVHGARMTGAGFGGCVVAFVEDGAVESVAEEVTGAYERETGVEPDAYRCEAAEGARVE